MWKIINLDTNEVIAFGLTDAQCDRYMDQHGMKNVAAVRTA